MDNLFNIGPPVKSGSGAGEGTARGEVGGMERQGEGPRLSRGREPFVLILGGWRVEVGDWGRPGWGVRGSGPGLHGSTLSEAGRAGVKVSEEVVERWSEGGSSRQAVWVVGAGLAVTRLNITTGK